MRLYGDTSNGYEGEDGPGALLKRVLEVYKITPNTLSKISGIEEDVILGYLNGRNDFAELGNSHSKLNFDSLLFMLAKGIQMIDESERVKGVIDILNQHWGISYETIALYAKLDTNDVQQFMKDPKSISIDKKYSLSVTSLFLHYLFKPTL